MNYQFNDQLSYIFTTLKLNGYQVYLVGGSVRDILLNQDPHDYDIATSAKPKEAFNLFKDYKIKTEGINEGSLTLIINDNEYEITTFRLEDEYKDHRHPSKVEYTTNLSDDLKRRDFTINALAYNPSTGLIDLYNGLTDIKNRLIRTIGKADKRFNEDALRILRALRFGAQLDFTIEENTSKSIFKNKELLNYLSAERIAEEFIKIILSVNCDKILIEYKEIFYQIYPQLRDIPISKYKDTCKKVAQCKVDTISRLAIFFSNVYDYKSILSHFNLGKKFENDIEQLIKQQYIIVPLERIELKRFIHDNSLTFTYQLIRFQYLLKYIDALEYSTYRELLRNIEEQKQCYQLKDLAINGNDLLALGLSNKEIGILLQQLLDLVIEEQLDNNKETLLNFVKKLKS